MNNHINMFTVSFLVNLWHSQGFTWLQVRNACKHWNKQHKRAFNNCILPSNKDIYNKVRIIKSR